MTLRNHYTAEQRRAAEILDFVKGGKHVPQYEILWALITLGESID